MKDNFPCTWNLTRAHAAECIERHADYGIEESEYVAALSENEQVELYGKVLDILRTKTDYLTDEIMESAHVEYQKLTKLAMNTQCCIEDYEYDYWRDIAIGIINKIIEDHKGMEEDLHKRIFED